MATIASLLVKLGVDTDQLRDGLLRASDYIFRTRGQFDQLNKSAQQAYRAVSTGAAQTVPYVKGLAQSSSELGRSMAMAEVAAYKMDAALKASNTSAGMSVAGFSRIRLGLTSLIASMTGTLPVLDKIGGQFLLMGAGGGIALGVIATLAAIGLAYRALTRDARELAAAQDKALESLIAIDKERRLGAAGKASEDNAGANAAFSRILTKKGIVADLEAQGGAIGAVASFYDNLIGITKNKLADAATAVHNGNKFVGNEITLGMIEDRTKQASVLAENIAANNATHGERLRAVKMLREDQALMRQYIKAGVSGEIRSALGSQIQTLETALNPKNTNAADAVSQTQALISKLDIVNEKYAEQATHIVTATGLLQNYKAHLTEATPILDEITKATDALEKSMASGALNAKQAASAIAEVLKGRKAIDAATNPAAMIAAVVGTASSKLAGSAFHAQNADQLEAAYMDAHDALSALVSNLDSGLIPATAANVAQMNNLYAALGVAADRLDHIIPSRAVPLTRSELLQGRGRQQFQSSVSGAANSLTQTTALAREAFSNIGLGFQRELDATKEKLVHFALALEPATVVSNLLSSAFGAVSDIVGGVVSALNPFASIISGIATAAKPLEPVLATFANIVAQTLGPVFEAFEPVLAALLPLVRAVFQVLSPILRALAPLFMAFIPILNALFPLFKEVAIVTTYLGQALALGAQIILNIVGALAVTLGGIIAGIGSFISHIPFLGGIGRDIQDFGNGIKNFGHGTLEAANSMGQAVKELGKARDDINAVNLDPTATAVDHLADAANAATQGLLNVPTWYKVALARFAAAAPGAPGGPRVIPGTITPPTLPIGGYPGLGSSPSPAPSGGSPGGGTGTSGPGSGIGAPNSPTFNIMGDIMIDAQNTPAQSIFDVVLAEAQKRARQQFGNSTLWSQVQH